MFCPASSGALVHQAPALKNLAYFESVEFLSKIRISGGVILRFIRFKLSLMALISCWEVFFEIFEIVENLGFWSSR